VPRMIHIDEVTLIQAPIQRCFDLSRSVEVHLLSNVHSGEQALATGGVTTGLIGLNETVTWRARHFGVWQALTSRMTALDAPAFFQVTMVQGTFKSMQADHLFRELENGVTEMRDVFRVAAPLPLLGPLAEVLFLRRYMLALLRERNAVIKRVAESAAWKAYLPEVAA
jgi:ligand-binding SRPBCC domain-containing protein